MTLAKIGLVALGGALGSVLRYLITTAFGRYHAIPFPYGTFTSNILGCLFIGLFSGWLLRQSPHNAHLYLLLITGFCGGFTTFSTFSAENLAMLQQGHYTSFALYTLSSLALCLMAVMLGFWLARQG